MITKPKVPLSSFMADRISDSSVKPDLRTTFIELCSRFGFTNATYFGSHLPGLGVGETHLVTTYSKDWVDHYFARNYQFVDPVVKHGLQTLLPIDWDDIVLKDPSTEKFFGEASEFGVGRAGLTVTVRGAFGDIGLFSVNTDRRRQEWQIFRSEVMSDLTYLAFLIHEHVIASHTDDLASAQISLTAREEEVLRWAAHGKTAWETAQILNLSEKTVAFYISNVSAKLSVATKTQAVAKAITQKLLIL